MPDPALTLVFAIGRLLPLLALLAYTRGSGAVVLAAIAVVGWALRALEAVRVRRVGEAVRRAAAVDAATAIVARSPVRLRGQAHGAFLVRLWRGMLARGQLATAVTPQLFAMAVATPCAFALAWVVAGPLVPIATVAAGLLALGVRVPFARRLRARLAPVEHAIERLAGDLGTAMRALEDLQAHGLKDAFRDRVAGDAETVQRVEAQLGLASALTTWTPILVTGLAALAWLGPGLTARDAVAFVRASSIAAMVPIGVTLARSWVQRARFRGDAAMLDELVAAAPDVSFAEANVTARALWPIRLESVSYRPPPPFDATSGGGRSGADDAAEVFSSVTLSWDGTRPLGLIGPNGSGKSSLFALVLRSVDPSAGRVTVDGVDLRRIDPASFHPRIAYVSQRPLVLEGMTVREAMQLVAPAATEDALHDALAEIGVLDRLAARGAPLDVLCSTLSGGEAQRVAIARALCRDAELLLLDEPEAGLDAAARASLRAALERRIRNGARVIIAAQHGDVFPEGTCVVELPISAGAAIAAGVHTETASEA